MTLLNSNVILALGAPPTPAGTQADPRGQMIYQFGIIAIMFVMVYFVFLRPGQKKAREREALLKAVRPGDKVTTSGGIVGVVISVKEKTLTIRSADAKFEVTKASVAEISERGGESSES
jgi:preprotein translocase subunit YajC